MSDINQDSLPQPEGQGPKQRAGKGSVPRWRRALLMTAVLAGGVVIGAGGLAVAAVPAYSAWRHGPRLAFIQHFVLGELDSVGATTAQEAKVHDIIAVAFAGMEQAPGQRDALRKQALDLLRVSAVDRAAAEKLRADQVARLDGMSKRMVGALLDVADQLTPEQRTKLVDRAEAMAQRGPWGGPHGRAMGGQGRSPMDGERGQDPGPRHGDDGGPDRG